MGESVDNVNKDVHKLLQSFNTFQNHGENMLAKLIEQIETFQNDLKDLDGKFFSHFGFWNLSWSNFLMFLFVLKNQQQYHQCNVKC